MKFSCLNYFVIDIVLYINIYYVIKSKRNIIKFDIIKIKVPPTLYFTKNTIAKIVEKLNREIIDSVVSTNFIILFVCFAS